MKFKQKEKRDVPVWHCQCVSKNFAIKLCHNKKQDCNKFYIERLQREFDAISISEQQVLVVSQFLIFTTAEQKVELSLG